MPFSAVQLIYALLGNNLNVYKYFFPDSVCKSCYKFEGEDKYFPIFIPHCFSHVEAISHSPQLSPRDK